MTGARSLSIGAPDGRILEVLLAGRDGGTPLFLHHGTPGAAGVYGPLAEAGAERGLLHVAYSRPGYSGSTRQPGRTVSSCAEDVTAIADALGFERFLTLGGSGGGPHTLACAALLPERVIAAATIASGAPFDAPGLDWMAGMGKENLDEFAAAGAGDAALEEYLEREAQALAGVSGQDVVEGLGSLVSDPDRRALSGAFGSYIAGQIARSLSTGIWGWFDDDKTFLGDWGFDVESVAAPVSIWHGAQDGFVPVAHGEWLASHVPRARAHLRPDHGHLSLTVDSYGEVLDDLLDLS